MNGVGRGGVRVLRALVFVAASLTLTVAAHVAGGGSWAPAGLVVTAALVWPVALLGSASQRRVVHLAPTLALGQVGGHLALCAFQGSAPASLSLSCVTHAAHVRHPLAGCPTGVEAMQMAGLTSDAGAMLLPSASMVATHLVATVLTALVLARGEQALWQVLDLVLPHLPHLLPRRLTTPGPAWAALLTVATGGVAVTVARGPPATVA